MQRYKLYDLQKYFMGFIIKKHKNLFVYSQKVLLNCSKNTTRLFYKYLCINYENEKNEKKYPYY